MQFSIFRAALGVAVLVPGSALAQAQAECEYRNPHYPEWNFRRSCTLEVTEAGDRVTTVASVGGGSTLTIVQDGGEAPRYSVNGHTARLTEDGASRCFLTIEDDERICIHGAQAVAALPAAPASEAAPAAPAAPADLTGGTGTLLGGGEAGHCLSWLDDGTQAGLIATGDCVRRTDCAEVAVEGSESEGTGGMSCLIDIAWESGRETVITRVGGVYTLDGAVSEPDDRGCLNDTGAGLHFCFSTDALTAAAYPALDLGPVAEEDLALAPAAAAPAPAAAAAVPAGNRCSFLRDEIEVSSWACSETVDCDAPICTVSYVFENGTTVTLDTADGKVMLMNGAKADPALWAEGAVVDVTRPGAPYTFRFTPGDSAEAAEAPETPEEAPDATVAE